MTLWVGSEAPLLAGKVHIIASPYKTGTTSVGQALVKLGVGKRMMPYNGRLLSEIRPLFKQFNPLANQSDGLRDFCETHGNDLRAHFAHLAARLTKYDVFHDAPFGHGHLHPFVIKALMPEARFIWINRDSESWIRSVRNWEETHPDLYPAHVEWQTDPEERTGKKRRFWRRRYRNFNRVRRGAPRHCLELEWSDLQDYTALAGFYGVEPPKGGFPQANVSSLRTGDKTA